MLNGMGEAVLPCGATIAIMTEEAVTLHTHNQPAVDLPACRPLDIAA